MIKIEINNIKTANLNIKKFSFFCVFRLFYFNITILFYIYYYTTLLLNEFFLLYTFTYTLYT